MSILYSLMSRFFNEEKYKTIFIILISCLLNIIKINGLSFISANIIKSIEKSNINDTVKYYKYFIIVSIIFILLFNYYKILQNGLLSKLRQWVRYNIMKILLYINHDHYSDINFTKLNTPTFRIANNCFYFFNNIISTLMPNLTLLFMVFIYFIMNDLLFGVIFLVGNSIIIIYILTFWNELMEYNNKVEDGINSNESFIVEILNNFDKIIYRGETTFELKDLWKKSKELIDLAYDFYKNNTKHILVLNIIIFALIFILLFYLISLFYKKKINATIFITFLTILLLYRDIILSSIQQIPDYIEFIGRASVVNNIFDNVDINKLYDSHKIYEEHKLIFKRIEFNNVHFKYRTQNKKILNNFNLNIDCNNNIVGIIGLSGAGKSTFVKLLVKMYKYNGNIYIDDVDINTLNTYYIRKNIVYVNQNTKLFDKKIIENIFYGCNDYEQCDIYLNEIMKLDKIRELYKNVDLYKKNAGFGGENLSGGQRQVINIINGLISPAKILILDEPTNALDPELKKEIIQLIKIFKKYKQCIIVISHDKDIFPIFDETIDITH